MEPEFHFMELLQLPFKLVMRIFVLPESLPKEKRRKFEWKRANPIGSLLALKNILLPMD